MCDDRSWGDAQVLHAGALAGWTALAPGSPGPALGAWAAPARWSILHLGLCPQNRAASWEGSGRLEGKRGW